MTSKNNTDRQITIFICIFAIAFGLFYKLLPVFFFWQGQNNLKNNEYIKAFKNLKAAYKFNRHNKDYRYYYNSHRPLVFSVLILHNRSRAYNSSGKKRNKKERNNLFAVINKLYFILYALSKKRLRHKLRRYG